MGKFLKWMLVVISVLASGLFVASCSIADRAAFAPAPRAAILPETVDAADLRIETEDGELLVAWQVTAAPGCPTVLGFHGNAQHLDGVAPRLQRMNGKGVGYLAVAYRGYSGSTGKPTEKGVRQDARAAYAHLRSQGIDPVNIVIEGFSLGSSVATGLAAEEEARALVLLAPFESGTRMASQAIRFLPMGLIAGNAFRSDRLAADVTEPVLILHGEDDGIIPSDHSLQLQAKFTQTNVTRFLIANRKHNDLIDASLDTNHIFPFLADIFQDCSTLIVEPLE